MSLDRIDLALRMLAERDTAAAEISALTPREQEIVRYTVKGLSSKDIAGQYGCGETTIQTHRARAMKKLDVDLRGLIVLATKAGLA